MDAAGAALLSILLFRSEGGTYKSLLTAEGHLRAAPGLLFSSCVDPAACSALLSPYPPAGTVIFRRTPVEQFVVAAYK